MVFCRRSPISDIFLPLGQCLVTMSVAVIEIIAVYHGALGACKLKVV